MGGRSGLILAATAAIASTFLPPVSVPPVFARPSSLPAAPERPASQVSADAPFDVTLAIDYSSAEETLRLLRGEFVNTKRLAALRGNRIAAATSALIAGSPDAGALLGASLDSLQARQIFRGDLFRLEDARRDADAIASLLDELKRRNVGPRVVATIEQLFPRDLPVRASIPVHVVALGHENADAYVRRIVWRGEVPEFTGEGEGELTIIINLAAAATHPVAPEERLSSILVTVAHEVFHAAFGAYKDASPAWKRYRERHDSPAGYLLDLVQNEGIAYYLSLEQRLGDRLPRDWVERIAESFATFNRSVNRLLSGRAGGRETAEIVRNANLSGYWESYGSMTGMAIARAVDRGLGRAALIETLSLGPLDFLRKYRSLAELDSSLPPLSDRLVGEYGLK